MSKSVFRLRPPRAPRLNENDVEAQVLQMLRYRQYRPERLQVGLYKTLDGRYQEGHPTGTPDYVCTHELYPAFYLEVKRPGGKASPEQVRKHIELRLNRLAVIVIDGIDPLLKWLAQHEGNARKLWQKALEK